MGRRHREEMNAWEAAAFDAYYAMGGTRSLDALHRAWPELIPQRRQVSLQTLKYWSVKFLWQARIARLDAEANHRTFEAAVQAATRARTDVLRLFSTVTTAALVRIINRLREHPEGDPDVTVADVHKLWQMARIEMGLPTEHVQQETHIGPAPPMSLDDFDHLTAEAMAVLRELNDDQPGQA